MSVEAILIQAGEGKTVSLGGTQVAYKAEGERPGGGPTFLEIHRGPGLQYGRPYPQSDRGDLLYRRGRVQIRAGDRMLRAKPGDFVLVPPGVPHSFGNPEGGPAKMVLLISPAGVHERYFRGVGGAPGQTRRARQPGHR